MKYKVGDIVRWKMCGKKGIVTKAEPLYRKQYLTIKWFTGERLTGQEVSTSRYLEVYSESR